MAEEISPREQQELEEEAERQRELKAKYEVYVVGPDQVDDLWNSEDPCNTAQDMLLEHLAVLSEKAGQDLNAFDQNENRYEKNQELKWLADFVVNALVHCKHDLKMDDPIHIAEVIECLWKTLDYHNI